MRLVRMDVIAGACPPGPLPGRDLVHGNFNLASTIATPARLWVVGVEALGAGPRAYDLAEALLVGAGHGHLTESADLRRLDAQIRDTRSKLAVAVQASGTTLTEIFGVGPVIAAAILGAAEDVSRFGNRDRFAAYNGTAPIEVSSGGRKIHRLSPRGNRRLNHVIHMAAVTQIRYTHSPGRAYFDRKIAEGKTGTETLRCLKRQHSDAVCARLAADAGRRAPADADGPGGQAGNGSASGAAGVACSGSRQAGPCRGS